MPKMVLNREYTLASLAGRVINFHKGIPVHVPPECVREALQVGAEGADEKLDVLTPEVPVADPLTLDERKEMIKVAFYEMVQKNDRTAFTAQGIPAIPALVSIVGFDVAGKERDEAWTEYLAEKSDADAAAAYTAKTATDATAKTEAE